MFAFAKRARELGTKSESLAHFIFDPFVFFLHIIQYKFCIREDEPMEKQLQELAEHSGDVVVGDKTTAAASNAAAVVFGLNRFDGTDAGRSLNRNHLCLHVQFHHAPFLQDTFSILDDVASRYGPFCYNDFGPTLGRRMESLTCALLSRVTAYFFDALIVSISLSASSAAFLSSVLISSFPVPVINWFIWVTHFVLA